LVTTRFREIKPEIRIVGVDDSPHVPRSKSYVPIVGAVFRGGLWLEGGLSGKIQVDGFDSTQAITDMITSSPHFKQLRVIMLNGVTFAGFNVVDLQLLNENTNLPVIAVARKKPDLAAVKKAIQNLPEPKKRLIVLQNAGELVEAPLKIPVYIQTAGLSVEDAWQIVALSSTRSSTPEPLRAAHLIASAVGVQAGTLEKV
jgi:uncharacterized protein